MWTQRVVLLVFLVGYFGISVADGSDEGGQAPPPRVAVDNIGSLDETQPPPLPHARLNSQQLLQSSHVLWFVPSDHDGSVTCLMLINSTSADQSVMLDGYGLDGTFNGSWNIPVSAGSGRHVCTDNLVASPPPSWADTYIANFTDYSNYVRATLPVGVDIDGFISINTATGTYDPRASTNTIELTFHEDLAETTIVNFAPQDSDANATCLNLFNTSAVNATIQIRGYGQMGALVGAWPVSIPAHALVRVCSDPLVANAPPSWVGTTIVNFTDFAFRAQAVLPPHVMMEGFVQWNAATGTIDPRATDSNFLKLRFTAVLDHLFGDGFEG